MALVERASGFSYHRGSRTETLTVGWPMQVRTVCDLFRFTVSQRPRHDAFRERRDGSWVGVSSLDFARDVAEIGAGLTELGVEAGDRVAILSENRYAWAASDFAALTRGAIVVPVYPTLPPAQIGKILEHSGSRFVFASNDEQVAKLLEVGAVLKNIVAVVTFDPIDTASPQFRSLEMVRASGATALAASGAGPLDAIVEVSPDDLATIVYTSGTTGEPKGVMLSHANLVANVADSLASFPVGVRDSVLSFLPLSHVFERTAGLYVMFHAGASIAYAESIETVPRDALETRPTIMLGVPRFFEKFHTRVLAAVAESPAPRRKLFHWALGVGERTIDQQSVSGLPTGGVLYGLARMLVYNKLRARIGGRLRFFVSGSAPLRADINRFFHAIGLPIYEGYGLTEASPVISANTPGANRIGSVGRPFPRVRVRLGDDGEIQAQGPSMSRGYFRDAEATRELFTEDGWLRTGDVGRIDADGFIYITDRKKELIVTAGGKNVAPQPIEGRLRAQPHIADGMLIGDGRRFIAAMIIPDFDALAAVCAREGLDPENRHVVLTHPAVREVFEREVEAANAGLARYETIKRFHLLEDELSVEDGSLTPTLKLRRRVLLDRYFREIEMLYREDAS